jgi:hypothetical protein
MSFTWIYCTHVFRTFSNNPLSCFLSFSNVCLLLMIKLNEPEQLVADVLYGIKSIFLSLINLTFGPSSALVAFVVLTCSMCEQRVLNLFCYWWISLNTWLLLCFQVLRNCCLTLLLLHLPQDVVSDVRQFQHICGKADFFCYL